MQSGRTLLLMVVLGVLLFASLSVASRMQETQQATKLDQAKNEFVEKGRALILDYRFLPRDFHQSTFDDLWQDWPEPIKSKAANASVEQRRLMAYQRYGFSPRPDDPAQAMQFTVDEEGWWAMNCFSCHGGSINGNMVEGLPNANIALETLYDDLRRTKRRRGIALSAMDLGSMAVPMGTSNGTSNAVVFGIALMSFRDKDLNLKVPFRLHPIIHHDMDAPAWWNVSRRERLYVDGFVQKNHRALIPFVMDQSNTGETMRGWEDEFKDVFAYIESLEPPKYPHAIDTILAARGRKIFTDKCASCHGTYGATQNYPSRVVPLKKIGTDPVRLKALTEYDRRVYRDSWFAHYGEDETVVAPTGYVAPPLNGIWASGPYFHNGSVPTIAGVLDSESRPIVWTRDQDQFDTDRVGLKVLTYKSMPESIKRKDEKRKYFDTRRYGKTNTGHTFGDRLSDSQRHALLEYLKQL